MAKDFGLAAKVIGRVEDGNKSLAIRNNDAEIKYSFLPAMNQF